MMVRIFRGSLMRGVVAVVFAVSVFGLAATAPEDSGKRPPNVLLLISDQHNYKVLGSAGNTLVKTPNLDRLASEGATVTRATAVTPFCSPTRASLVTGQWPHVHGIVSNVVRDDEQPRITDQQTTLDNLLFDNGYRLRHFGRWMVGKRTDLRAYRDSADRRGEKLEYSRWFRELRNRFTDDKPRPGEVFLGKLFMTGSIARAHAIWKNEAQRSAQDLSLIGRSPIAPEGQLENWLADKAIDWMEANADKPFMLTYSIRPPHASWAAPDPYYGMYDPEEIQLPASFYDRALAYQESQSARMVKLLGEQGVREYLRCYYAQVTMVDSYFGKILNKLRELGLEENTLVIFTSDHGDMQGGHAMMGKLVPAYYDEIVRVPLIVRYPRSIPNGLVLDQHASSVDMMPTVLDYLDIPIPETVQGRSLRPQLDGKTAPDDRPAFSERWIAGPNASRMIRTRDWKYSVFGSGRRELFHLAEDPHELRDLARDATFISQRKLLEQQLREWMRQTRDPLLETLFASSAAIEGDRK